MNRTAATAGAITAFVALVALGACARPDPGGSAQDPGAVALRLFVVAADPHRPEDFRELFDSDVLGGRSVSLLDALEILADSPPPELLAVQADEDGDEAFVDLAVELPGEGRAFYSVQLRRIRSGGFRVAWFQGPGVEWPSVNRRGDGLSTSSPP